MTHSEAPRSVCELTADGHFLPGHQDRIAREFADSVRALLPAGTALTGWEMHARGRDLLTNVVRHLDGQPPVAMAEDPVAPSMHDRMQQRCSLASILAEYRALRATLLRAYENSGGSDLTEVRRFNDALDRALTESLEQFARQADRQRDQFIGVLGHDLRTPLDVVSMGAAILDTPDHTAELRRRVVARIRSSARRMERMITDLLDLTRFRLGGSMPLERRPVDLRSVCEEVLAELAASHPEAELRCDVEGVPSGEWDADRLMQVVSNLAGNAVQHGGGSSVVLSVQDRGDSVLLSVHNGGPPIPDHVLAFVFEPLACSDGESATRGFGLGLFIAREIVVAHGGHIQASSSADAGTTFTVTLPKRR